MNLLVTLDRNYLEPLHVMLGSLFLNNPGETFDVYMVGDGLTREDKEELDAFCARRGSRLHPVEVPGDVFDRAPTIRYYSRAMYYRLLAAQLLPQKLDRVLYLDPDILVIGAVRPLYELELGEMLFAAATHSDPIGVTDYVNKVRLSNPEAEVYYNSGVLLMNLEAMRRAVRPEDIFAYVERKQDLLILPDQDILNGLYGAYIMPVEDSVWNYDARYYGVYRLGSQGERDMDWVMDHTVCLHFCGKNKPWHSSYIGRFAALYKHYQRLARRI